MKTVPGKSTASTSRLPKNRATFEDGLRLRIGVLLQERNALEEEVRQLRAAVQIYSEVVRRLQVAGPKRAASNVEFSSLTKGSAYKSAPMC